MFGYYHVSDLLGQIEGSTTDISLVHYGRSHNAYVNDLNNGVELTNIVDDYYKDTYVSDGIAFTSDTLIPYMNAQKALDADYDITNDDNAPVAYASSLANSILEKYQGYNDTNYYGLFGQSNLLTGGINAETQPAWERAWVDSFIQNLLTDDEVTTVRENYFQEGRDSVASLFDDDAKLTIEVQVTYAQSNAFLKLDEEHQIKFMSMSLANQMELVLTDESDRDAFVDANTGFDATVTSGTSLEYRLSLSGQNDDVNADFLARFQTHLDSTGINYESEWNDTYQAQTQTMDFSAVANQLNGIYQLYQGFLGRAPDKDGFEYWLGDINNSNTLEQVAEGFVYSDEFLDSIGESGGEPTFDAVLTGLYDVILGRTPDQEGYDWWEDKYLNEGYTLGNVVTGFTWSDEFATTVASDKTAWMAATYGPNLVDMDMSALGFSDEVIEQVVAVGVFDANLDGGYDGIVF